MCLRNVLNVCVWQYEGWLTFNHHILNLFRVLDALHDLEITESSLDNNFKAIGEKLDWEESTPTSRTILQNTWSVKIID